METWYDRLLGPDDRHAASGYPTVIQTRLGQPQLSLYPLLRQIKSGESGSIPFGRGVVSNWILTSRERTELFK
jgi:hypothetical protein